jgi:hypothetical protein
LGPHYLLVEINVCFSLEIFWCPGCHHSSLCVSVEHLFFLRLFVPYHPADTHLLAIFLPVPLRISSILSTQRADQPSPSLVPVSPPTPLVPGPIPPLGILGSVCVPVSIASISSLRVCLLASCAHSMLCPPFQNLLSVPVLRLTLCSSFSSSSPVRGRGEARPPAMSLVSRLSRVLPVICVTVRNRQKSWRGTSLHNTSTSFRCIARPKKRAN